MRSARRRRSVSDCVDRGQPDQVRARIEARSRLPAERVCTPAEARGRRRERMRDLDGACDLHRHRRRFPQREVDVRGVAEAVAVRADGRQQRAVAGERGRPVVDPQVVEDRRMGVDAQGDAGEHRRAIEEANLIAAILDPAAADAPVPADRERAPARRPHDPADPATGERRQLHSDLPAKRQLHLHLELARCGLSTAGETVSVAARAGAAPRVPQERRVPVGARPDGSRALGRWCAVSGA